MDSPPVISRFDKSVHDRSGFSCGHESIDNFLKSSLSSQAKADMVAAFMATSEGDNSVLGFYALRASVLRSDLGPKSWRRAKSADVPSIYVRMLAVREGEQGKGLGRALMMNAMKRCSVVADEVGVSSVFLDVLHDDHFDLRWKFYSDLGFVSVGDPENPRRMYIQMSDVRRNFG